MHHVNLTSGGVASAVGLFRLAERFKSEATVTSLFCDTKMEDEDLYRFNAEVAKTTGVPLLTIADGRDPWQVYFDRKYLGNTRIDPCSEVLKRALTRNWLEMVCDKKNTIIYVGYYLDESDRLEKIRDRLAEWRVESPLLWKPEMTELGARKFLEDKGVKLPRLYGMGFSHNNCGGFCCKAGQGHFQKLLQVLPERYAYHEGKEQEIREYLHKDVAILRSREGGTTKPLTLKVLRESIQSGEGIPDADDQASGCACFSG